jgi:hypothetical protein
MPQTLTSLVRLPIQADLRPCYRTFGGQCRTVMTTSSFYGPIKGLVFYQGHYLRTGLQNLPCVKGEIMKRFHQAKEFVRLPKCWIVERTIAGLNRCKISNAVLSRS